MALSGPECANCGHRQRDHGPGEDGTGEGVPCGLYLTHPTDDGFDVECGCPGFVSVVPSTATPTVRATTRERRREQLDPFGHNDADLLIAIGEDLENYAAEIESLSVERDQAVEALRALNTAIWKHDPNWAAVVRETGRAAEVISRLTQAGGLS